VQTTSGENFAGGAGGEPGASGGPKAGSVLANPAAFDAIGEMAGQIAHDFNNLLTPLLAYPPLIRRELPEGGMGQTLLDVVERATRDMAHIARQLLALGGRGMAERRTLNLNGLVSDSLALVADGAAARGIAVRSDLSEDTPDIAGCSEQVLLILRNVLENAVEAVRDGGAIAVRTERCEVAEPTPAFGSRIEKGTYARVTVRDDGPGISAEVAERLFDPFVTTKKAAERRGAGLGLTIVYRLLRAHGGHVRYESFPGKGTTFRLHFPVDGAGPL
jgi:signal transduction histidine kinase